MILSELIAEYRKQREITVRGLAKKIGIPHSTLWRFEQGEEIEGSSLVKIQAWSFQDEFFKPANKQAGAKK